MTESKDKFTCDDIIFSYLKEDRYEEYMRAANEWYASLPENNISRDFKHVPRLSQKQFRDYIDDATIIIIACLKETDELIASIAVGQPKESPKGLLTSTINLYAVNTLYRRRGVGGIIFDEGVRTARLIGAQRLTLTINYDNKFQKDFMINKGLVNTQIKTFHKSDFIDNKFLSIRDYATYLTFEKIL